MDQFHIRVTDRALIMISCKSHFLEVYDYLFFPINSLTRSCKIIFLPPETDHIFKFSLNSPSRAFGLILVLSYCGGNNGNWIH